MHNASRFFFSFSLSSFSIVTRSSTDDDDSPYYATLILQFIGDGIHLCTGLISTIPERVIQGSTSNQLYERQSVSYLVSEN